MSPLYLEHDIHNPTYVFLASQIRSQVRQGSNFLQLRPVDRLEIPRQEDRGVKKALFRYPRL